MLTFSLREICPNTEFFWSVFCRIRTEYREIRSISPYSVQMRENTDQKKLRIWTLFRECFKSRLQFRHSPYYQSLIDKGLINRHSPILCYKYKHADAFHIFVTTDNDSMQFIQVCKNSQEKLVAKIVVLAFLKDYIASSTKNLDR